MQNDERLPTLLTLDFHILPREVTANARAERFRDRLLRRETGRDMRCRRLVQEAVADFVGAKNASEEAFPEPLEGAANPRHFNDVDAGAENHDKGIVLVLF